MYLDMILGPMRLGVFLMYAARDPLRHTSLIWFTVWSSVVHASIMTVQSLGDHHLMGHLYGDVPALYAVAAVLVILTRAASRRPDPRARPGEYTMSARESLIFRWFGVACGPGERLAGMMSVWSMSSPVSPIRVRQQAAGLAPGEVPGHDAGHDPVGSVDGRDRAHYYRDRVASGVVSRYRWRPCCGCTCCRSGSPVR